MRHPILLGLVLLGACDHGAPVNGGVSWDMAGAAAGTDGLYVPLSASGGLVRVAPDGEITPFELGAWTVDAVEAAPGGDPVLARLTARRCEDDPARKAPTTPSDCDGRLRTVGELRVLRDGDAAATFDVPPVFGAFTFSEDGQWAAAIPDAALASRSDAGLVSLDTLLLLDLVQDVRWQVPVGFDTRSIRYLPAADGSTAALMVMSASEVAIVDLSGPQPDLKTTYPLTLDDGETVQPVGVALTATRSHALITVQGKSDLYTLDLVNPSINLVALPAQPTAMYVDVDADRSLLAYGSARIDVLDHDTFTLTSIALDAPVHRFLVAGEVGVALAAPGVAGLEAYRLDLSDPDTVRVEDYRLSVAPRAAWLAPDASYALVQGGGGVAPRLQVLDLREVDGSIDDDVRVLATEGDVTAVVWTDPADGLEARILQAEVDRLYTLDPGLLVAEETSLSMPPAVVGALPDGTSWIGHRDALGRISFLASDGEITVVEGFARYGRFDGPTLLDTEEE